MKWPWPNLSFYPGTCQEELTNTTAKFGGQCIDSDIHHVVRDGSKSHVL
jgi:hypothetical protein